MHSGECRNAPAALLDFKCGLSSFIGKERVGIFADDRLYKLFIQNSNNYSEEGNYSRDICGQSYFRTRLR